MQLYLYSCQDLIIKGNSVVNIKAGDIYRLQLAPQEMIEVYPTNSSGVILLNSNIISSQQHSQIIFHKLNEQDILCEIKPFVINENINQYLIKGANLKFIQNINNIYIYFNGVYQGLINCIVNNIKFNKIEANKKEVGVVEILGDKKYIILFNNSQILYCGQYIDSEQTKRYIQIYCHTPNIFNIGRLIKYNFLDNKLDVRCVCDRGEERKQLSFDFNIIYFLEAIKCGRFKYAHNKLSYELKSIINIDTLTQYFTAFDNYIYLAECDTYITIKNNKVIGVYHFVVKDNLIDNIY